MLVAWFRALQSSRDANHRHCACWCDGGCWELIHHINFAFTNWACVKLLAAAGQQKGGETWKPTLCLCPCLHD